MTDSVSYKLSSIRRPVVRGQAVGRSFTRPKTYYQIFALFLLSIAVFMVYQNYQRPDSLDNMVSRTRRDIISGNENRIWTDLVNRDENEILLRLTAAPPQIAEAADEEENLPLKKEEQKEVSTTNTRLENKKPATTTQSKNTPSTTSQNTSNSSAVGSREFLSNVAKSRSAQTGRQNREATNTSENRPPKKPTNPI